MPVGGGDRRGVERCGAVLVDEDGRRRGRALPLLHDPHRRRMMLFLIVQVRSRPRRRRRDRERPARIVGGAAAPHWIVAV